MKVEDSYSFLSHFMIEVQGHIFHFSSQLFHTSTASILLLISLLLILSQTRKLIVSQRKHFLSRGFARKGISEWGEMATLLLPEPEPPRRQEGFLDEDSVKGEHGAH